MITSNKPRFEIGQRIYHVLGGDNSNGIITGILLRPGWVVYYVTWQDKSDGTHYEIELSAEPVRNFAD